LPQYKHDVIDHNTGYRDGAGNTVEENSSVFNPNALVAFSALTRLGGRKGIRPVKKWGMVEVSTG